MGCEDGFAPQWLQAAGGTCHPDSMNPEQQPVDRVSYYTANEKGVLMFNKVLVNSAHEYAYASQRDELEQLLNLSRSRGALRGQERAD